MEATDYIEIFDRNVNGRIRDIRSINKQNALISYLFLGVALGVIISRIACLCPKIEK